jgi:hypothetical protein
MSWVHRDLPVVLVDGAADDEVLAGELLRVVAATEGRLRLHLPPLLLLRRRKW